MRPSPTPTVRAPLLLLLLPLLLRAAAASLPAATTCGTLLPRVASVCAPALSARAPAACCASLRLWNSLACWCDPSAARALALVAGNAHAFSGRAGACGIGRPLVGGALGYSRWLPAVRSRCPPAAGGRAGGCKAPGGGKALRRRRVRALRRLDALALAAGGRRDVERFRREVRGLLDARVRFGNAGQFVATDADGAADYLLARQKALGCSAPIAPGRRAGGVHWRDATRASYEVSASSGGRFVFVQFAACSARMRAVTIAEKGFLEAQYAQYFYSKGLGGVVGQFDLSAEEVCGRIARACRGKMFPYRSRGACVAGVRRLKARKRVMCNRLAGEYVPQLAVRGDSIACRVTFAAVARTRPGRYCPMLAGGATGLCAETACPRGLYADVFAGENPRHQGPSGFFCSRKSGICKEAWP